jgi:succinate dehydrogenase/fumarate reductase cytochrome b subunit
MHRISGLATLLFLSMHILLESTAHFTPHLYNKLNSGLRNPFALAAETLLAFFVIFHSVNGLRISYFDLFSVDLWALPFGPRSARTTWALSFILWVPALVIMILHGLHLL